MNKKDLIIKTAADLFHQYGYGNVGLTLILEKAGLPKGSFYYYFKSKDELLMSVIQHFIAETICLFNTFPKTMVGLHAFFNAYFERFELYNFTRGCPIGNFALELSDVNENARLSLIEWTTFLDAEIGNILSTSTYRTDEASQLASFIVASFEGVLLKAKIEKSNKSLKEFEHFVFGQLLKSKEM